MKWLGYVLAAISLAAVAVQYRLYHLERMQMSDMMMNVLWASNHIKVGMDINRVERALSNKGFYCPPPADRSQRFICEKNFPALGIVGVRISNDNGVVTRVEIARYSAVNYPSQIFDRLAV